MTNKNIPLMRKATAVWLVDNTFLTFKQISNFCALHELEIKGIADGDVAYGIKGQNPIHSLQLTKEEITRCEKDPKSTLTLRDNVYKNIKLSSQVKKTKYIPVARRQDKPNGIAFLLKYYPDITNLQIRKLIGTTNAMIDSIRNRTHRNYKDIKPRDVILLELCTQSQLNEILSKDHNQNKKNEK